MSESDFFSSLMSVSMKTNPIQLELSSHVVVFERPLCLFLSSWWCLSRSWSTTGRCRSSRWPWPTRPRTWTSWLCRTVWWGPAGWVRWTCWAFTSSSTAWAPTKVWARTPGPPRAYKSEQLFFDPLLPTKLADSQWPLKQVRLSSLF